jgi:hypothetical protein
VKDIIKVGAGPFTRKSLAGAAHGLHCWADEETRKATLKRAINPHFTIILV